MDSLPSVENDAFGGGIKRNVLAVGLRCYDSVLNAL